MDKVCMLTAVVVTQMYTYNKIVYKYISISMSSIPISIHIYIYTHPNTHKPTNDCMQKLVKSEQSVDCINVDFMAVTLYCIYASCYPLRKLSGTQELSLILFLQFLV